MKTGASPRVRPPVLRLDLRARLRSVATVWRRSIQARVVISTLLLSAVVVSLVGWVLLQQITDGLVRSKTESSVDETSRATAEAQRRLSAASGNAMSDHVKE